LRDALDKLKTNEDAFDKLILGSEEFNKKLKEN
jgi:uncharacterized protein YdcH (DUF465 family)